MSEDFPVQLAALRPGLLLAGYRLEAQIGSGGMAVVFRARDERLGRLVALKVLAQALAADSAFRRRFVAESRAASAVDDPHIIPIYEADEANGVLFIAMRFVPGGDLGGVLEREGPLAPARTLAFIAPVASALDAAHGAGLVHRDVKPANILVDARPGRPEHVYLSDFGVSKGAVSSISLTGAGHFVGTPDYSAPEQIRGLTVDGRTDQYALACVTYQLLTGSVPFGRDQGMAVLFAHLSELPRSVTSLRPDLPYATDQVLAKALAKAPEKRYESCQDFANALQQALGLTPYIPRGWVSAPGSRRSNFTSPLSGSSNPSTAGIAAAQANPSTVDSMRKSELAQPADVLPAAPARRIRWLAPLVALLVIVIPVAIGGAYGYSYYMNKYHPADYSGSGTGHLVVQVKAGDTPNSLALKLQQLGVVASAHAFVLAAEHSTSPAGLLPGFYGMHLHMKASLAYALLLNPKDLVQISVTIPEGWRLSQIVAWLGTKSGIPASAYNNVLSNPAALHLPAYANGKPEGYLFPATYNVLPDETALGVLTGMVQRFDQEAAAINLPSAASQVHLTESQVIIMASLVQAQGARLSDYPKIARVIYNRLAQRIPLQLDSTVLYGLSTYGIIASDQQLTSSSPYNTYRHTGLPPGPIDSPGDAAIQAVLNPAAGNWLYFVTVNPKTGETLFTSSPAQFQQYRAELAHSLGQG